MVKERRLIGEYLVEKGILSREQLDEAIKESKVTNLKIGDILIKKGFVKEEDVVKTLSEQLGIPFINISTYRVDPSSVSLISKETARRFKVVPIYRIVNTLTVAMVDPLDIAAIDELERLTNLSVNPVFATASGIDLAIEKYYYGRQAPVMTKAEGTAISSGALSDKELTRLVEEATQAPVVKIVNEIIAQAIRKGASDIHLEPQEEGFYYRYRIDGVLQDFIPLLQENQSAIISRFKIMADIDIAEKRLPHDGRIQLNMEGREVDLRVTTFPTIYGEHVAIRVLDKSKGILKLDELGFEGELLKKFKTLITKPHGIILVTGPTGSGKTTTLYSVLNALKDLRRNIITLEDPVEYTIESIHQSQVNVKAGLTFAGGLRSIVRLDPDIIMIGEIRDKETAEIAIQAALTGHLVFSTLHTNDAPSACTRLIDIGIEPYLVASSITAVLAQRLVRRLCQRCREAYRPTKENLVLLDLANIDADEKMTFYKENGCKECYEAGFKGRTGIYELFLPNDKMRELITKKVSSHELLEEAKKAGMTTLLEDGLAKVKGGITSLAEILRVTEEV
jgi:type IV pilus assembly protein PilB